MSTSDLGNAGAYGPGMSTEGRLVIGGGTLYIQTGSVVFVSEADNERGSNMNEDTVRIGTIVHFVYGDTHLPAIVTDPASRLYDPSTDGMIAGQALTVFPPSDAPFTTVAARDDAATPATWHWPEGASV